MTTEMRTLDSLPLLQVVLAGAQSRTETLPLGGGFVAHVVARPGDALNRTVHERVYEALVPVSTRAFAADMTPYWAQRSREGYLERLAEFVLVGDGAGRMVGWTGSHVLPYDEVTVVYLDSTGMVPAWQSRGVMRQLMGLRVRGAVVPNCPQDRPVYIAARTESPVFYRLVRGLLDDPEQLYPNPRGRVPAEVSRCAWLLAGWLGQRHLLDAASLQIRGAYDTLDELYGELPTTGEEDLDRLFRSHLGPLDAYLIVGRGR